MTSGNSPNASGPDPFELDLVQALGYLTLEELQKILTDMSGWTVSFLGCSEQIPEAALILSSAYSLNGALSYQEEYDRRPFDYLRQRDPHSFRLNLLYC